LGQNQRQSGPIKNPLAFRQQFPKVAARETRLEFVISRTHISKTKASCYTQSVRRRAECFIDQRGGPIQN